MWVIPLTVNRLSPIPTIRHFPLNMILPNFSFSCDGFT